MRAAGIDPAQALSLVREGIWTRMHHGVYVATERLGQAARDPVDLHRLLTRVAVAALPGYAYPFGRTAALSHGLPFQSDAEMPIALVRPRGADQRCLVRRITGPTQIHEVVVRSHLLGDGDIVEVDGLPVVSRDIAAVSTAATQTPEWAVAVLDAAAWQRPGGPAELARVADQWPRLQGIGTVRRALPLVRTGAQSPLESLSRVVFITRHGLPEPVLQRAHYDHDGLIGFTDMDWDDGSVVGECDGLDKYQARDDLVREKAREDRLRALGVVVVRWTWRELMTDSAKVAARIQRARAAARGLRRRTG